MPSPVTLAGASHPCPVAAGASHFRLRKGGIKGAEQTWADERGVLSDRHPIENFDVDLIVSRWGYDTHYYVQFSREEKPGTWLPLGGWKSFGLAGKVADAEEENLTSLVPPGNGTPLSDTMTLLMSLDSISEAKSRATIESARLASETSIQAVREGSQANIAMMTMFMRTMLETARPAQPAADPTLVAVLTEIRAEQKELRRMLEEDPEGEEEDDEEADHRKHLELVRNVRKNGLGAVFDYLKDEGAMALIDALPLLKLKMPQIMATIAPMIQQKLLEIQNPPPPPPPQIIYRERVVHAAPPEPQILYGGQNGATPEAPLAPPQGDDETPAVV